MLRTDLPYWTQRVIATFPTIWASDASFQPGGFYYQLIQQTAGICLAYAAGQIDYTQLQTRIATATDQNLEAIGNDYFGVNMFPRFLVVNPAGNDLVPESDAVYSARIQAAIFAPKNTIAAIQTAVQNYINTQYVAETVSNVLLLGTDTAGGIDTRGGLDGRSNSIPQLPTVYVCDLQSDPKTCAVAGITPGQFLILFLYGGLASNGFFVGRTYTNRSDYLITPQLQIISPLTSSLAAIVNGCKAKGLQPIYADNRV